MTDKTSHLPETDCLGVATATLLDGRESDCPQCETELSTLRRRQVDARRFSASSEVERLLDWPLL